MANEINAPSVGSSRWAKPDPDRQFDSQVVKFQIKKEKEEKPEVPKAENAEAVESPTAEPAASAKKQEESPKRVFSEKEKLNSPLALAQQGRRSIRHETLERDHDEH